MSFRFVFKQVGLLAALLGATLLAIAAFSGTLVLAGDQGERWALRALLLSAAGVLAAAAALWSFARRAPPDLGRREAMLLVAASWLLGAACAGLPYLLWAHLAGAEAGHPFRDPASCYFEAMSGLTTTGASVLGAGYSIEEIPRSLLLWRSLTQWIGGLGIVVLFVAVLPSLGAGGKRLFRIEAPGHAQEGIQPQVRQTARVLLSIYLVLTAVEFAALMIAGMSAYDSLCHTFGTISTGGFSTRNASVGAYESLPIDWIVTVFMVAGAINFSLYFALARRKFATVLGDAELRTYLIILGAASLVVAVSLVGRPLELTTGATEPASIADAIRHGAFNTVSISTTTGFCTADYNDWPFLAQAMLVLLMFIGGSAGSTSGGIKVIRLWIALKILLAEIEQAFRPQVVRPVRLGNHVISAEVKLETLAHILLFVLLFAAGSAAVMLLEQWLGDGSDYTTAASASVACLSNVGPGLGRVGAVGDYGWMTPWSKVVLSVLMALGRLELFAIIALVHVRFWRED